jgi:putative heme iron utilization protein
MPGEEFDPNVTAKDLIRRARRGALATRDAESGAPYASLVAVATAADGAPLLLLSGLARHTRNLGDEPRVSLLVEDGGWKDPLAGPRVTVMGTISRTEDAEARRRYLARLPSAEGFAGFADFGFYRLEPDSAHLVAGFGRIQTLPRSAVMTDISDAAELLAAEEGAVAHMNEDHADALALYATKLLGASAGNWRCDGLDPEGVELSANGKALYLRFPERVRAPGPLRQALVALAEKARSG